MPRISWEWRWTLRKSYIGWLLNKSSTLHEMSLESRNMTTLTLLCYIKTNLSRKTYLPVDFRGDFRVPFLKVKSVFFFWKIKINTEFPSGCFRREIEKADYQTESGTTEAGNKYLYRGVYKKGLVAVTWNFIMHEKTFWIFDSLKFYLF